MRKLTYINPRNQSLDLTNALFGITKLDGLGVPNPSIQEKKAPYQDGTTPIDVLLEPREVSVEGVIALDGEAAIYQARRQMSSIINLKYGPGTLIYSDDAYNWRLTPVTPNGPVFANRSRMEGSQKWTISFYSYNPYWDDVNETQTTLNGTGTLQIVNNGDVQCPMKIIIHGPITNPTVYCIETGQYITITKDFASNEFAMIYTGFGEKIVYINSGEVPNIQFPVSGLPIDIRGIVFSTLLQYNGIGYLSLGSTFLQLGVGMNTLQLTDSGSHSGMSMQVAYRQRYIGN